MDLLVTQRSDCVEPLLVGHDKEDVRSVVNSVLSANAADQASRRTSGSPASGLFGFSLNHCFGFLCIESVVWSSLALNFLIVRPY
jgi:hypothetical protein